MGPGADQIVLSGNQFSSLKITEQFKVFERKTYVRKSNVLNRRDFYKISLTLGTGRLHYADKGVEVNRPALLFSNPLIPYIWEPVSRDQDGYFCLFSDGFLKVKDPRLVLQEHPLFAIGADPVFFLEGKQKDYVAGIFRQMLEEYNADYVYKFDLLRNLVNLLMHEAMKMQPVVSYFKHKNAAERITSLFLTLLERQFPIDSPQDELKLKTPGDYAKHLSVHVNHLNRSVRQVTARTTTEHINERIISEAKALLQHTNWSISDIAYSLGYEYPTYFHNFFKRQTNASPGSFREN
ncbi:MAG TPA: helix-turn-helix transcriptional regulator [Puia sp.]|nr:helix-turn-helix transcriptional regulator [Puia sp.]